MNSGPETQFEIVNSNLELNQSTNISGRRQKKRFFLQLPITLRYKADGDSDFIIHGVTLSFHDEGVSCKFKTQISPKIYFGYLKISTDNQHFELAGRIIWVRDSGHECGVRFEGQKESWLLFLNSIETNSLASHLPDRRSLVRRKSKVINENERRFNSRRFLDLAIERSEDRKNLKIKKFLRNKATTYNSETIKSRREWLENTTDTKLKHISCFSEEPEEFKGKIESPIGVAHVPIGIAGPLKINGDYARGVFFIPMATTEGALITSYTFGANIITKSGGANVKIIKDELKSDPTFVFKTSAQAYAFTKWLDGNFQRIKDISEKTSKYLRLLKITSFINGRRVIVNFHFFTSDAMGMNMTYKATDTVCKMIRESVYPEEFWLHSNFSSIKKVSGHNFLNGYGKTVIADVTIPREILKRLKTTPESMARYYYRALQGSVQGLLYGVNGHFANAMTALYIACGQDAALVANTHAGIITCEVTKSGDLFYSAYIPNLFAATVGGGTGFGTGRECLEILDCYGKGKSTKFAEIIAATVLAGEISITTSIVNETYIYAHETFGRNKPR